MNRTLLALLTFLCFCCKDEGTPPPPYGPSIILEAVDASCTEAWLKSTTTVTPATLRLLRDSQRVADLRILTADSLLIDDDLLPNHQYSYQLQKLGNDSNVVEISTSVQLTTMDTTSHVFAWEIDTLGEGNSSALYDVAIINDTLAYAVGEMYLRDSTGQIDPILYNLAVWNGHEWKMRRITWNGYPARILFIYALNQNDIWFGMGYLVHWDGLAYRQVENPIFYGNQENRMWGTLDGRLYVVGNNGTIAYSPDHGTTWQRVPSSTSLDFRDVYGGYDAAGRLEVVTVASSTVNLDRIILHLVPNVSMLSDSGLLSYGRLGGIWLIPTKVCFVVGDGIYSKHEITSQAWWKHHVGVTPYYTPSVRGISGNDIFVTGVYGDLLHFNGFSWHSYRSSLDIPNAILGSVSVRDNLTIVVGFDGSRAVAIVGRRQARLPNARK